MAKMKCAIIGSGNIGTDLMIKLLKGSDMLELAAVVGIDPASEGLAMARERGVTTTHEGIEGLRKLPVYPEIGVVFDATSAYAHKEHDAALQQDGKLIGVISHVPALKERIGTQIQVIPGTGGRSSLAGPGCRRI